MKVTVEVSSGLVRIARSPLRYVLAALTGVSLSFAPLCLYASGRGMFFPTPQWVIAPMCLLVIFLVPLFYLRLGGLLLAELLPNLR